MENLHDRLIEAERIINEPSFLKNKGLGNEVGYYIFTYPAEEELTIRAWIGSMQDKYRLGSWSFQIVVFDLYDIMIDILKEKGFIDKCFEFEQKKGIERITKAVGNIKHNVECSYAKCELIWCEHIGEVSSCSCRWMAELGRNTC